MSDGGSERPVERGRRRFDLGPSLQRRVGRFTILAVAIAVLVTGLGAYVATSISVTRAIDAVLVPVSTKAVEALGPDPDAAAIQRYVSSSAELGYVVTAVIAADGQVYRTPGADVIPVEARDVGVARGEVGTRVHNATTAGGAAYRVRVVPIGREPGFALLVGRPLAAGQQILGALATALVVFAVLAVVAASVASRRFARAGIAPVRELTAEIEERAADGELAPVKVTSDDEIGRLAGAFNHLLEVITVSRTRQSRFVADAGHELRTPLTSMRTNIDLLAVDAAAPILRDDDRLTIMRDVRAQLAELSDLVSDLIGLTREDRGAADFDEVDLTTVLEETVDRVSMRGSGLGWRVELDPAYVAGDADLLAKAFANVLDNAVKFSPEGGTITVTLHDGEVRIADEGRGVAADERPYVFDRFFRSEASRATPGTGLGLSVTESVVRQHGGSVTVTDAPGGGAMFVLRFPDATRTSRHEARASSPAAAADLRTAALRGPGT